MDNGLYLVEGHQKNQHVQHFVCKPGFRRHSILSYVMLVLLVVLEILVVVVQVLHFKGTNTRHPVYYQVP
jgi:hypothetical protein